MRKIIIMKAGALVVLFLALLTARDAFGAPKKARIFVVDSYHREYLWSQDTHAGVCVALLEFGFLDDQKQVIEYTENDHVESSRAVVRKVWMNTKRKNALGEIAAAASRISEAAKAFGPDIILLGDDDAANYIGNLYIDTKIPVVFWGINGIPLKYGLIDSIEKPGHNITGIYQANYLKESVEFLKQLVPGVRTLAVLSEDSSTGRPKAKELERLAAEGKLAIKLAATVMTNSWSEWKSAALRLQKEVDAFFVLNHNTLKDDQGRPVDQLKIGAWYLRNIRKPECGHEKQFALEGLLLVVDDSGFKQGYEAVKLAYQILVQGKNPGDIPVRAPARGPVIVNRKRADMLGIDLSGKAFIEEFIDHSLALEKYLQ
ncbi:MAG: ABC transporter substrate binding protein [Thermodesulfobacteriota bacterium]